MKLKQMLFILVALFLLIAITACGAAGNDQAEENEPEEVIGEQVVLKATNWAFDQESYTVPAGDINIALENVEGHHGIEVDGTDVSIAGEGSVNTSLEPGEYTIRCTIPCGAGHAEMLATLIVE
ncbi:cytochrome C oxidase subunit II [Alkalihalobacillus sp. FSL R5-0424]